jgi:hypothetical protein
VAQPKVVAAAGAACAENTADNIKADNSNAERVIKGPPMGECA